VSEREPDLDADAHDIQHGEDNDTQESLPVARFSRRRKFSVRRALSVIVRLIDKASSLSLCMAYCTTDLRYSRSSESEAVRTLPEVKAR